MPCLWPGRYDHWLRRGLGNGKQASFRPSGGREDSRERVAAVIAGSVSVMTHPYRARCPGSPAHSDLAGPEHYLPAGAGLIDGEANPVLARGHDKVNVWSWAILPARLPSTHTR